MIIHTARFQVSNSTVEKCPADIRHEYAFIGRSNVGKSSLINMLLDRNGLAKTSSTPGKTMLINHFLVNDSWNIVDLPGYGYARRGKESRDELRRMIEGYILGRAQMTNLFLLIDSRHEPQKIDLEFMNWLGENGVPFSIVFTKMDKMGPVAGRQKVADYCAALLEQWEELPPVFMTSSEDKRGRDEILGYIEQLNRLPIGGDEEPTGSEECYTDESKTLSTHHNMDKKQTLAEEQLEYPGMAIDAADKDKVDSTLVKEEVKEINNNPRNTDDKMP